MAQLWGGRFTKETDQLVYNFNASITFDKRFYKQDIKGSLAHVAMLAKQGILTEEEKEQITDGLNGILEDVESGKLEISDKYEGKYRIMSGRGDHWGISCCERRAGVSDYLFQSGVQNGLAPHEHLSSLPVCHVFVCTHQSA